MNKGLQKSFQSLNHPNIQGSFYQGGSNNQSTSTGYRLMLDAREKIPKAIRLVVAQEEENNHKLADILLLVVQLWCAQQQQSVDASQQWITATQEIGYSQHTHAIFAHGIICSILNLHRAYIMVHHTEQQ